MKDRLTFFIWIVLLTLAWLPGKVDQAGIIIAVTAAGEGLLIVSAGISARSGKVQISCMGKDGEKNVELNIRMHAQGLMPVRVEINLETENRLTGETVPVKVSLTVQPRCRETMQFLIAERHCGKITIHTKSVSICDIFGIGRFRAECAEEISYLLLPPTGKIGLMEVLPGQYDANGERYLEGKAGDDLSEVFEIREYREGDRINGIHWKLSSKAGELVVKEGSCPAAGKELLLLENAYDWADRREGANKIEAACGRLISLSEEMLDRGDAHYVGWWDVEQQEVMTAYVDGPEGLAAVLPSILSSTLEKRSKGILEKYYEKDRREVFSFIAVIDDEFTEKCILQN